MQPLDCIVIGAGQCGLYAARCLAEQGRDYLLLERDGPGAAWRHRLSDLRLFTSRAFCALPGKSMPGKPDTYPTVDEMASYLESYADQFELNILAGTDVKQVTRDGNLFSVVTASGTRYLTHSLINATGSNQVCIVPEKAKNLDARVAQYTASVRDFNQVQPGSRAVVVGSGASGRQIAALLREKGVTVTLATGRARGLPPNKWLGRDIFWWLKYLGVLFADKNSLIARVIKKRNPVPCGAVNNSRLLKRGVDIRGRAIGFEGNEITFSCGTKVQADLVIWALGYRDQVDWLQVDGCVSEGQFVHDYGVTPEPGIFIVGRKWLSCRASELVMGVEADVNRVMGTLSRYLEQRC